MIKLRKWIIKTGTVKSFGRCSLDYDIIVRYLSTEHYLEDNPLNTHSGRELFWLFEVSVGVLLAFKYHEVSKELYVGTNASINSVEEALNEVFPIKLEFSDGILWS